MEQIQQVINLVYLAAYVLEPLQVAMNEPIKISSGFRCHELNRLVGGTPHSQHLKGEAADIYTDAGRDGNLELGRIIVSLGHFDQLIFEHVGANDLRPLWLHVSWRRNGDNRQEVRKLVAGTNTYPIVSRKEVLGL